jgi:hypothetical protein
MRPAALTPELPQWPADGPGAAILSSRTLAPGPRAPPP